MKKIFLLIFNTIVDSLRPSLGAKGCCIYYINCRTYAKETLNKKPLYLAIPVIILRLLSCNPITAVYLKLFRRGS